MKSVAAKGLITLDNGEKLRKSDGGSLRSVPAPTGYRRDTWLSLTPELERERDAAVSLYRLRERVKAIKLDELSAAQCEAILLALTP